VIGSPVGATRELLADGVNGLWVKTSSDWVSGLAALITDAEKRQQLAAAGRRGFEERYEAGVVFEQLRRVVCG